MAFSKMMSEFDTLHLLVFDTTLVTLILLEQFPKFQREYFPTFRRWTSNIGLLLLNGFLARVILPISVLAFAMAQPPGVMSSAGLPPPVQIFLGFVFLDFAQYWTHRLSHSVPLLWRVHLVHHSDTHIDVTTSQRHHPLESLFGSALSFFWIYLLGIPAEAFGLYILVAAFVAVFSHANISLPESVDRWLRQVIVTPGMHAIHHSSDQGQTDSNYAIVLAVWDRWFGTYTNPSRATVLHFGLEYFHQPKHTGPFYVLLQPFVYKTGMPYADRNAPDNEATNGSGNDKLGS